MHVQRSAAQRDAELLPGVAGHWKRLAGTVQNNDAAEEVGGLWSPSWGDQQMLLQVDSMVGDLAIAQA